MKLHLKFRAFFLCRGCVLAGCLALPFIPLSLGKMAALAAQNQQYPHISGTFWLDLDLNLVVSPYSQASGKTEQRDYEDKLSQLIIDAQNFVRDEASYIFHGLIYGFQVVYRPPDRFHRQDETLLVIPEHIKIIRPEDLDIYHVSSQGDRYYYSIRKQLSSFESRRMEAWQQADKRTAQAYGAVPFAAASGRDSDRDIGNNQDTSPQTLRPELMIQLRKAAVENAIKEAVRSYFRRILRNKPSQIRVNLALSDVPKIAIGSGELLAEVRLHIGQYSVDYYETR